MNPIHERIQTMTRRHFFGRTALGLGTAALASLLPQRGARPTPRRAAACPACRTSPRRPSAPSTCS